MKGRRVHRVVAAVLVLAQCAHLQDGVQVPPAPELEQEGGYSIVASLK